MSELYMAETEIARRYRLAKNPRMQIGILAELNLCTRKDIVNILEHNGLTVDEKKQRGAEKFNWQEARTLYCNGALDKEIAAAMGCTAIAVFQWRKRNNLPPNARNNYNWTEAEKLYNNGAADKEIAAAIGCTSSAVTYWRKRNNLPSNNSKQ